jgi:hypothetical protein
MNLNYLTGSDSPPRINSGALSSQKAVETYMLVECGSHLSIDYIITKIELSKNILWTNNFVLDNGFFHNRSG